MKLVRIGDHHSQERNYVGGSKYGAQVNFWAFGKGKERASDFRLHLDMADIVLIVSKMADHGHETAKWLEDAMRLNVELAAILKEIDQKRISEREEEEEYERKSREEHEAAEREWQAEQSKQNGVQE